MAHRYGRESSTMERAGERSRGFDPNMKAASTSAQLLEEKESHNV